MKKLYIYVLLAMTTISLSAQDRFQERMERLKAQKIAFITQRINLTPDEAQVFWPVYNELALKKEELNKKRKEIAQELKNNKNTYSETEKEKLADEYVGLKLKDANLDIEYHEKFKKILSIDKVLKLYQAEMAFKGYLMNKLRQQNSNGGPQRPPHKRFE
ncbi:MAG: hypothetical protein GXO47_02265 [Chlorobi bacterium]|nr:hypothetical protein [Chlorobiota bacterium]